MSTAASTAPTINRRDFEFNLFEVLDVESLTSRPRYADHDRATFDGVLDTAQAIAENDFQNHYRLADRNPPYVKDGKVVTLPETRNAIRQYVDAGFMAADRSYDRGGMQLPFALVQSAYAFFQAANVSTTSYLFLTSAAASVIENFGSPEQIAQYAAPMLEGRFLGTMCLSEPQAGSGLADLRTRATPREDGTYLIRGTKMWISAGEHEMSENIVHLLLARLDGAPAGIKGISMFIVPKRRLEADGGLGPLNGVRLVGLNHKMGVRGITNTVLSFGEKDDCVGYLVGEPHRGLTYMFQMMNEARISVGLGATMLGSAGYLASLDYAKTRTQGRLPTNKDPSQPPVPIIRHVDVRRMLLTQKAYVEGALALCLYAARLVDDIRTHPEEADRKKAELLLELLTPIVKAWPSEYCLEANKHAIQVLGGYGYTQDFVVEQFYRDNRLNPIHEGTNGIQAIDLMGRKVLMHDAATMPVLAEVIGADIAAARKEAATRSWADDLQRWHVLVKQVTAQMAPLAKTDLTRYLANATAYADAFGHLVIGWMLLRQARVAAQALDKGAHGPDIAFYKGKLSACGHFFGSELGRIAHWMDIVTRQEADALDVEEDWL